MPGLLFVLNDSGYFLSHRLQIALAARTAGFDVHVATPESDKTKTVRAYGFTHHPLLLTRSGSNPFLEILSFMELLRIFRETKPDLLHLVTIKPVIYGGVAARLTRVPAVVVAVSGLGIVFSRNGFKENLLRFLIKPLYRAALAHPGLRVIFQNPSDSEIISRLASLRPEQICLIHGSGVELTDYAFTPLPDDDAPIVLLPARLLKSKGVPEFVDAARQLRARGVMARFVLAGAPDAGNPDTVTEEAIAAWVAQGLVEHWGYCADMPRVFAQSSLVILPSFYPEGLPKTLIEAQACGRAIVTTECPGCRDAIVPDETGLLVPPRDAGALADAIERLLRDRQRLRDMGRAGRALAESRFDVRHVVERHLEIYQSLMQAD
ncbi:MAG: glycosyltransferase family 4 protein [Zoogloeaceae bacterium]|nr:glycosyltransferase family 4 protein [Zoogloeaceae bacterium]